MPRDIKTDDLSAHVDRLNATFRDRPACAVLAQAISDDRLGPVALASSFGADSIVLIHMVAQLDRTLPVLFLDTGQLFAETLRYQREVAADLGLTDLRVIRPDPAELLVRDTDGILHQADQDACCTLRKVEPLERALAGFGGWITGRKRFQGGRRVALEHFELQDGRVKVNPLAHWDRAEVRAYVTENGLPLHPLQTKGFTSIGCEPCTVPTRFGEDARAGRWPGQGKVECGIHFEGGRPVREGVSA
jgi:phosphoadenosine phosphosulfate reductase